MNLNNKIYFVSNFTLTSKAHSPLFRFVVPQVLQQINASPPDLAYYCHSFICTLLYF